MEKLNDTTIHRILRDGLAERIRASLKDFIKKFIEEELEKAVREIATEVTCNVYSQARMEDPRNTLNISISIINGLKND